MLRALLSLHAATALKVAVTGATGRLGRRAVEKLVAQGAAVRCLVRHEPAAVGDDAVVVVSARPRTRSTLSKCRSRIYIMARPRSSPSRAM